jgi:hypothetical protein
VQALQGVGVTVAVRRNGPYVGQHRHPQGWATRSTPVWW